MELKGREIISLPVIDKSTGKEIGEVKKFVYSLDEKKLKALIIEDKGWLWGKNLVYLKDIESIGKDAIIINSAEVVSCTNHDGEAKKLCDDSQEVMGYKMITNSGEDFGIVEDLVFETESGIISGFEISNGLFSDLLQGRTTIDCPKNIVIGEDTLILDERITKRE